MSLNTEDISYEVFTSTPTMWRARAHLAAVVDRIALGRSMAIIIPLYPRVLSSYTNKITAAIAKKIIDHISDALAALHFAGWVHCDVKPANIFIDQNGNFLLGDFGATRIGAHLREYDPHYLPPKYKTGVGFITATTALDYECLSRSVDELLASADKNDQSVQSVLHELASGYPSWSPAPVCPYSKVKCQSQYFWHFNGNIKSAVFWMLEQAGLCYEIHSLPFYLFGSSNVCDYILAGKYVVQSDVAPVHFAMCPNGPHLYLQTFAETFVNNTAVPAECCAKLQSGSEIRIAKCGMAFTVKVGDNDSYVPCVPCTVPLPEVLARCQPAITALLCTIRGAPLTWRIHSHSGKLEKTQHRLVTN
eukprot:TRINITY_DN16254_c0_g1_i2.p1 TRINITY_DN16254_c0_g1~~TRINITY_DN16254_c0_g1_i2.p1  ORF type:complete len:362 (-),score=35.83 TRINITY_DN16254_c0_g1_i2:564-1649(-)